MKRMLSFNTIFMLVCAALVLVACGTTNDVRRSIGFEGDYVDACEPAVAFEERAICTIKVYRGTLEVFVATAEANPSDTMDQVIIAVARANEVASPAADIALQSLETYIDVKNEIESYQAAGQTVPPDLIVRLDRLRVIAQERYAEAVPEIRAVLASIQGES